MLGGPLERSGFPPPAGGFIPPILWSIFAPPFSPFARVPPVPLFSPLFPPLIFCLFFTFSPLASPVRGKSIVWPDESAYRPARYKARSARRGSRTVRVASCERRRVARPCRAPTGRTAVTGGSGPPFPAHGADHLRPQLNSGSRKRKRGTALPNWLGLAGVCGVGGVTSSPPHMA